MNRKLTTDNRLSHHHHHHHSGWLAGFRRILLRWTPGSNKRTGYWLEARGRPTTTQQRIPRLVLLQRHTSDAAAVIPDPSAAGGGSERASRMAWMSFQRR